MKTIWTDEPALRIGDPESTAAAGRRSSGVDGLPELLLNEAVEVVESRTIEVQPGVRRSETPAAVEFQVQGDADEPFVTVVRHSSGALSLHAPDLTTASRRSTRSKLLDVEYRFRVPVHFGSDTSGRRGIFSKAIRVFVVKIVKKAVDAVADWAIQKLARAWESRTWKRKGLAEGWHRVLVGDGIDGLAADTMPAPPEGRALLLLHGTFSNAETAYGALPGDFFRELAPQYGDRIYAFNHFTISKTPEENARELLEGLPEAPSQFDVITHSRGGLVLRNLVERKAAFAGLADRIQIEKAVMVASPNEGTPLATPQHWQQTVGFFANLLEMFPDNPFTTAAEFVSEALVWIAKRATGWLPGIASMDMRGEMLEELQLPPGPGREVYYSLVANYHPQDGIVGRLIDMGLDNFFGMPNDLVVPTEGGWRFDEASHVAPARIGCFGAGGNLASAVDIHHGNFFGQPGTRQFLSSVLRGQPTGLPTLDPNRPLPDRRFRRGMTDAGPQPPRIPALSAPNEAEVADSAGGVRSLAQAPPAPSAPAASAALASVAAEMGQRAGSALNLVVLPPPDDTRSAQILATYANARVLEEFPTRDAHQQGAGQRWKAIIQFHKGIEYYINGRPGYSLPTDEEVLGVGEMMFETLFPGDVQRIYDVARSSYRGPRLPVVLTSMIPWIAEKPWEFAYDKSRNSFLATEEIHFIRNVLTAIPAEDILPSQRPLQILVVVAQPVGAGNLSSEQEITVIRRGFEQLTESGLAEVTVVPKATPRKLHSAIGRATYDIVHCICHGDYDEKNERGYLLFETGGGATHKIDERMVRELLCNRGIRLVFLNACETGRGGHASFNSGVAQSLVAGGIPAVVANQYQVLDVSATAFSQHFYWCLAQGMSIGESAREARISVRYALSSEPVDWAVPVVYARNSTTRLCERRTPAPVVVRSQALLAQPAAAAKAARTPHTQIGIWDISHSFPELQDSLERMNRVQDRFQFQVASLSLPLSAKVWLEDIDHPFIDADAVAERMALMPQELGVDFLACLTNEPLAARSAGGEDEEEYVAYQFAWTDERQERPIAIFSVYELEVPSTGPLAERAIANAAVFFLATQLGGLRVHRRGPAACPMHWNEERDVQQIVGALKFDPQCRTQLSQRVPLDLPALESLLKTFHAD